MDDYIIVTTVSTFTHRYVIPKSAVEGSEHKMLKRAENLVIEDNVTEFSQDWHGARVIGSKFISLEEVMELMDQENPYLKEWSKDQKKEFIDAWNDDLQKERMSNFKYADRFIEALDNSVQEGYEDFILRKGREENV
jgi:hypothetical protein